MHEWRHYSHFKGLVRAHFYKNGKEKSFFAPKYYIKEIDLVLTFLFSPHFDVICASSRVQTQKNGIYFLINHSASKLQRWLCSDWLIYRKRCMHIKMVTILDTCIIDKFTWLMQGSYRSWKTWKVMEFCFLAFQAWKVMEFCVE